MAGITTDTADNVGGKVALFGTVVFAVSDLSTYTREFKFTRSGKDPRRLTVLTSLVLIVTQCTVEGGEFSELVALELVLTFGNRSSLFATLVCVQRKGKRP